MTLFVPVHCARPGGWRCKRAVEPSERVEASDRSGASARRARETLGGANRGRLA